MSILSILSFVRVAFSWIKGLVRSVVQWALANPREFLIIALAVAFMSTLHANNSLRADKAKLSQKLDIKAKEYKEAVKLLNEYEAALEQEQRRLKQTIESHNKVIDEVQNAASKQALQAREEAAKLRAQRDNYKDLANKYARANNSEGSAEERIRAEEKTNDEFFQDLKRGDI